MSAKDLKTYQVLRAELDEILAWFESEEVDLDEAIEKYEYAMKLIAQLEGLIANAENKVKKINTQFDA